MSHRLTSSGDDLACFYIDLHSAHTTLAQACLGVLLRLDDHVDEDNIQNFPLSSNAAEHWVSHGQFEDLSSSIQVAMEQLFNPAKPHFSAWVWIYDMDDPQRGSIPTIRPERPQAPPIYYAVLCGFRGVIEHLATTYPMHVDAKGGNYGSPLLAALNREYTDTAPLRTQRGGDITGSGMNGVVSLLVEYGANVNSCDNYGWTPLHTASRSGNFHTFP